MKKIYKRPFVSVILPKLARDIQETEGDGPVVSNQSPIAEGKEASTFFDEDDTEAAAWDKE